MRNLAHYLLKTGILLLIYFITARIGLSLDAVSGFASFVWPPTGISFAALLLFGYKLWPGIFLAAFLANFSIGASIPVAFGIGIGNTLSSLAAVYLFNRFTIFNNLERLKCAVVFVTVAFMSTAISATVGSFSLLLGSAIVMADFLNTWWAWWTGDTLGIFFVGSLLLINWKNIIRSKLNYRTLSHFLIIEASLIGGSLAVFWGALDSFSNLTFYFIFSPLIWAALRFGQSGGVIAINTMSLIAIMAAVGRFGPFAQGSLGQNLLALQTFMGAIAVNIIVLGAVVSERRYYQKDLENLNQGLEIEKEIVEKHKAQYEALLSSVKDGIFAVDQAGLIIFFNKAAEEMLMWRSEEVIGRNIADFLNINDEHGEILQKNRPLFDSIFNSRTTSNSSYYYVRKNGTKFPVQMVISPVVLSGKVVGAVEVFRDITKDKELDKAKSEFISIASHQLRTPVTALKWLAEISAPSFKKLNSKERGRFSEMISSIERLSRLVEDLLNVSRIDLGTLRTERVDIDLVKFAEEVIGNLKIYADAKKHRLVLINKAEQALVSIDTKMLNDIFQNLISNAIDYSPPETTVTVTLEIENGNARTSVSNHGPAIPEEEQKKLFQKFYRGESTKKMKAEGTGLGLYIVKAHVESAGGKMGFISEEGKDTVFWFALPLINH